MIGDFTWAGYDYLGEAGCGIFHYDGGANFSSIYPERTAYIGDLDLLGNRRPISYLREIVYGRGRPPIWQCCGWNTTVSSPAKRLGCSRITFPVGHGPVLRDKRLRWMCTPPRRRWSCS